MFETEYGMSKLGRVFRRREDFMQNMERVEYGLPESWRASSAHQI